MDELDSILLIESSQPKVITGRVNVISSRWVASWLSYAAQWDGPKPGPIDNVSLTTLVNGIFEPKENLKLEINESDGDFRIVCREVWSVWIKQYGGGPEILADGSEKGKDPTNWMIVPPVGEPSARRSSSPVPPKGIEHLSVGRLDSIGINEGALELLKSRTRAASESKVLEEAALRQLPDCGVTAGKAEELNEKNTASTEGSSSSEDFDAIVGGETVASKSKRADSCDSNKSIALLKVAAAGVTDFGMETMKKATEVKTKIATTIPITLSSSRNNSADEPEGWGRHGDLQPRPTDVLMMSDNVNWLFDGADEDSENQR